MTTIIDTTSGSGQGAGSAPVVINTQPSFFGNRPLDPRLLVSPNDLLPVSFLTRGAAAAKAVGRIVRPDDKAEPESIATGFLISEDLLLTNWHVLRSGSGAKGLAVQFGYEHDGLELRQGSLYSLDPDRFFLANRGLDFSVVAVEPGRGEPLSAFGAISLLQDFGQARPGSWVNIVQHADGRPKTVVVRENMVVGRPGDLLLYTADTVEGSSGAPVFNDRWELVALHRRGAGEPMDGVVANIGVRASAIARDLMGRVDDKSLGDVGLLRKALGMAAPAERRDVEHLGAAGDPEVVALAVWLTRLSDIVRQEGGRPHRGDWSAVDTARIYAAMADYGPEGTVYGRGQLLDLYSDFPDDEDRGSWVHNLFHACGGTHG